MKALILARHAKTEQITYDLTDFDRELTPRGYRDLTLVTNHLIEKNIAPELIISSPAIRAKQTAIVYANQFNIPLSAINYQQFIYNGYTTNQMLEFISTMDDNTDTIAIIGHNPDIESVAYNLSKEGSDHFPTSALLVLEFNVEKWSDISTRSGKTKLYVSPRQLK